MSHLLVVREQVEEVKAKNGVLSLGLANYGVKFIVEALEDANVSLKLLNVLLLHREEGCELVDLACTILG